MLIVIFVVCIILALLSMLLFQSSILTGVLAVLFGIAGIVNQILRKKFPRRLHLPLAILLIILCVVCLWNSDGKIKDGGIRSYEKQLITVREYLIDGKLDKAITALDKLVDTYGTDDNILLLDALESLEKSNYQEAYEKLSHIQNKKSQMYYAVLEQVYIADPSEKSVSDIYEMYLEAAEVWPDWTYVQKYAGITCIEQDRYTEADYYLRRALAQDSTDSRCWYYLGVAAYGLGDYNSCRQYFNEALETGASEETAGNIVWYMQQIEEKGRETK